MAKSMQAVSYQVNHIYIHIDKLRVWRKSPEHATTPMSTKKEKVMDIDLYLPVTSSLHRHGLLILSTVSSEINRNCFYTHSRAKSYHLGYLFSTSRMGDRIELRRISKSQPKDISEGSISRVLGSFGRRDLRSLSGTFAWDNAHVHTSGVLI